MKKTSIVLLLLLFAAGITGRANAQQANDRAAVQVIQFHLEHRCITCLRIEKFTRTILQKYYPAISFALVNVEDRNNAKQAEAFQASGTALFLYNPATGKKKNLTANAFLYAGNEAKFEAALRQSIDDFLKG